MNKSAFVVLAVALLTQAIHAQPTLDMLVSFVPWESDEANPYGSLALGNDGNFYGTTSDGNDNVGTVFQITPGGVVTTLAAFNYTNGVNPMAELTLAEDGCFYGTTFDCGNTSGAVGTVFRVTTNGTLATLANFEGTNGANPTAAVVEGNDGNFYGTTEYGGISSNGSMWSGDGTVFCATTNGILSNLVNFNGTNGAFPMAKLLLGCDGGFYGTTEEGGVFGQGTVFRVTTNGILTVLGNFDGTNGANPVAALAAANDGYFYGTAAYGGINGYGTVFRVATNGQLTVLADFDGTNGAYPMGALTLGSDGNFYGTTEGGGYSNGNIFRVGTNGSLTGIVNFTGTNGNWPMSSLTIGNDGDFYGTTEEGGAQYNGQEVGTGTVFKLIIPPTINCLLDSNRVPQLQVSGLTRPFVQVQTTSNLFTPWSTLTNLVLSGGTNQFNDLTATNSGMRFYRISVE
jgi:uncharacterized repeat protein (TIGR03803 family)